MAARSATADSVASLSPITLVLGGARSGKSAYAEALIVPGAGTAGLYLATGEASDAEMAQRIAHHRARRGAGWTTVEEPLALAEALTRHASADRPVLVECLTTWVNNLMYAERDAEAAGRALVAALPTLAGPVVLVSNEVGHGIVPDNPLARRFRDVVGRLNQAVAASAQRVVLVAAGLPLVLKG
jgi:adenosylcobinamide kinase/adenosylcobinamide-phosphate guanylyltransferase